MPDSTPPEPDQIDEDYSEDGIESSEPVSVEAAEIDSDEAVEVVLESLLRCPLDPSRRSPLTRSAAGYTCNCGSIFPVRNSIPILLPREAELPSNCPEFSGLPCHKRTRRGRRR